jgi:NADH-quinone oxidoreductase subunit M
MQKAFFSGTHSEDTPASSHSDHHLPPITLPEKLGAILLIASSVTVGLFPHLLLNIVEPAFNSPLFEALRRGGPWQ